MHSPKEPSFTGLTGKCQHQGEKQDGRWAGNYGFTDRVESVQLSNMWILPARSSLEEAMRGELVPGSIFRDSLKQTKFPSDTGAQTHGHWTEIVSVMSAQAIQRAGQTTVYSGLRVKIMQHFHFNSSFHELKWNIQNIVYSHQIVW